MPLRVAQFQQGDLKRILDIGCSLYTRCFDLFLLQPKVVSDSEEAELSKQLEELEKANREVAGDDPDLDEYPDQASGGEEEGQAGNDVPALET